MSTHASTGRASAALAVLCLCLAVFAGLVWRGFQEPPLHASTALIQALVDQRALARHMKDPALLESLRKASEPALPASKVLTHRLWVKPQSRRDTIELRASSESPEQARALMQLWIDTARSEWPNAPGKPEHQAPPHLGPFLMIARPSL